MERMESLAEIKSVYYPGEMKLVSLDTLKLYRGEDVVKQNLEDLNPDRYVEEFGIWRKAFGIWRKEFGIPNSSSILQQTYN